MQKTNRAAKPPPALYKREDGLAKSGIRRRLLDLHAQKEGDRRAIGRYTRLGLTVGGARDADS